MSGKRKVGEWPLEWWVAIAAAVGGLLGLWGSGVLLVAGHTLFGVTNLVFGLILLGGAWLSYRAGEDD